MQALPQFLRGDPVARQRRRRKRAAKRALAARLKSTNPPGELRHRACRRRSRRNVALLCRCAALGARCALARQLRAWRARALFALAAPPTPPRAAPQLAACRAAPILMARSR
jgi:hypothetical protein